ncbi:MAG: tRNA pseudouridine(13) synthase TruD [Methylococcales bacterium]|nr:tRNA pseudouridine(13) synthase TruD [Methylococcales bacterium]
MNLQQLPPWNYAYGSPSGTGEIRHLPEDFIVEETLAFEPSGSGEHIFLQIQKTGENTEFVARQLARFAGVRQRDIGYAGLKDRHAVTTQWFSVWLPKGDEPNWQDFSTPSIQILLVTRHARKLKRGVLANNRFEITVKNWQGDKEKTIEQLTQLQRHGVPNYYGSQRFGHGGQNVMKAAAMFAGEKVGREQRSLYLSAARSFLFNEILATRIEQNCWNQGLAGDVLMIDGSHSCFAAEEIDDDLRARLTQNLLHPTGALFGSGVTRISAKALELEQTVFEKYPDLTAGLLKFDVENARRALRIQAANLMWEFKDTQTLVLKFNLPAGSYATAVLREIIAL